MINRKSYGSWAFRDSRLDKLVGVANHEYLHEIFLHRKFFSRRNSIALGFTLIELLVVLAIIGLLAGLLLPAVQGAREASRRAQCRSHLRNQGLAILNFENVHRILPAGRMRRENLDYSWAFYILPMLEQGDHDQLFDRQQPWNALINQGLGKKAISIFRCPSATINYPGDSDYAGLSGTLIGATDAGTGFFDRGALIFVSDQLNEITLASVSDGLSNTFCVSESPDREPNDGLWVTGIGIVSHDRGSISSSINGILSWHIGGANAARLDGSVMFVSSSIDEVTLGANLTRSGYEQVDTLE